VEENLTTQQKSRFRRAYRDTFTANPHGDAVKALYSRFSELYGVTVDSLRAIVSEELKKHPKEYAVLRRELAARQVARNGGPKVVRAVSATKKATPNTKRKRGPRRFAIPVSGRSFSVSLARCVNVPEAIVQTCIIHLIRNTFRLTSRKYWDEIKRDIKPIYTAVNAAAARSAFDELADKWGSATRR
jgi:hypothetical protein